MSETSANRTGALFALLGFALFSGHDVIVKMLGDTYSVFQIIFFSVLFSFPLVILFHLPDRNEDNLMPHHPVWVFLRTCSTVITAVAAFYAFSVLPLAQTYALMFCMPLLITILAIPILGEQVGAHRWAAVIVLSGLYLLLRERRRKDSSQKPVLSTRSRMDIGITPRISLLLKRRS